MVCTLTLGVAAAASIPPEDMIHMRGLPVVGMHSWGVGMPVVSEMQGS